MSYYQFPNQHSSSSSSPYSSYPMSVSGIQGQVLEVTVVGCNKLKDTEWISRQDPYVCLEYANSKHRTRTHTDGGKNPTFQEKFVIPLIEGLREINVKVWNSNSVTFDDFIGEGKVQLQKVLSQGYDDSTWPIQTKHGRYGGEVRLIMHYSASNISAKPNKLAAGGHAPSAPPYGAPPTPQGHIHPTHPPSSAYPPPPPMYPQPPPPPMYPQPPPAAYPAPSPYPSYSSTPSYPPNPAAYPPNPAPGGYPPSPYGAPAPAGYPPAPYPPSTTYPPPPSSTYPPPPSSTYPPPPQASSFYPPPQGPYGTYPPPPY